MWTGARRFEWSLGVRTTACKLGKVDHFRLLRCLRSHFTDCKPAPVTQEVLLQGKQSDSKAFDVVWQLVMPCDSRTGERSALVRSPAAYASSSAFRHPLCQLNPSIALARTVEGTKRGCNGSNTNTFVLLCLTAT